MSVELMRDLERRYQAASGLTDPLLYKIFFCQIRRADILALGINPGGLDPKDIKNGTKTGASAGYYENNEHDLLDCSWAESWVRELFAPLVGGNREDVRRRVVLTNRAFKRTRREGDLDNDAATQAQSFLEEIIEVVHPELILLIGGSLKGFSDRYCSEDYVPIYRRDRESRPRWNILEAGRLTLRNSRREVLGVKVPHISRFRWMYKTYGIPGEIRKLRGSDA